MQSKEKVCKIEDSTEFVERFFAGNAELISLYFCVQEEMGKCDPDLMFCARNGLIGLAKKDEKYRFFIAPSEDSYDIKFAHIDNKMTFSCSDINTYIKECERCVFYVLQHPESIGIKTAEDTELADISINTVLNRNQRKFCKCAASKNIRLLAPAGSGKTYCRGSRLFIYKIRCKECCCYS